jgi:hypothetical protein
LIRATGKVRHGAGHYCSEHQHENHNGNHTTALTLKSEDIYSSGFMAMVRPNQTRAPRVPVPMNNMREGFATGGSATSERRRGGPAGRRIRRNALAVCGVYRHSSRRHARLLGGAPDVPDDSTARRGFRSVAAERALTRRNAS